ncbi:hypothetical protein GI584_14180 [Gracilibacillus salitolerans]|uniref:Uncharacterized protein n=1 Tax=Gracilibacillus salitolerans TaxID=2663022 RepID=A0A5Q2TLU4_9BACI|nr:hypothetical protein [Gracilibacillus salitolerans]QGH35121.1 hypothetical protein GI584_14180 [Gracilibacillus salitolerans]
MCNNILNDKEKEVLNEIIEHFADDCFESIGFNDDGDPISYDDDQYRLEQYKKLTSLSEKLDL